MNKLIESEFKFCDTHLEVIEKIVVTSACSSISPTYLEGLKEINKKYKYTQCITCNSSIFLATNKLYKDYIYTKEQLNGGNQNGSKKESKSRKSNRVNKK